MVQTLTSDVILRGLVFECFSEQFWDASGGTLTMENLAFSGEGLQKSQVHSFPNLAPFGIDFGLHLGCFFDLQGRPTTPDGPLEGRCSLLA